MSLLSILDNADVPDATEEDLLAAIRALEVRILHRNGVIDMYYKLLKRYKGRLYRLRRKNK